MSQIVLISTGGTIASRRTGSGYTATLTGPRLLDGTSVPHGLRVQVRDLFTVNSSALTTAQQLTLLGAVHEALADDRIDGVVVTHGTDTLEESAFLLDLHHHDRRPVVFTGAQRPPDHDDSDAPANLRDALAVAACGHDLGVLVVFDGLVHAARGTAKQHTLAVDGFGDPSGPRIGDVSQGRVLVRRRPPRRPALALPSPDVPVPRVDIVTHHTGADPLLLRAAVAAGAQGVVLAGTGAGNATPAFVGAVAEAVSAGVLVALTSRVPAGPVTGMYTGGGAVDLIAAGAVPSGTLRAPQTRMAVLSALLHHTDPAERTATMRRLLSGGPRSSHLPTTDGALR
ncbi:asparaginase [Nocardiopsis lucentensis]|uniref:asparaginase n=1 Tax=Nocardiopsis lucentensis TaxID=53441 RepID=UPI000344F131|nr:asparaginase domain-containing protein [Nocardiopsis lucentensis]